MACNNRVAGAWKINFDYVAAEMRSHKLERARILIAQNPPLTELLLHVHKHSGDVCSESAVLLIYRVMAQWTLLRTPTNAEFAAE